MLQRRQILAAALSVAMAATILAVASHRHASATSLSSGGWTTSGRVSPQTVSRGGSVSIAATVTSSSTTRALVDVEVYDRGGVKVAQAYWDAQGFTAGRSKTFTTAWAVPATEAPGTQTLKVGIFTPGWGALLHWNDSATTFTVTTSSVSTTTSSGQASTTSSSTASSTTVALPTTTVRTTSTTSTTAPPSHFSTLPPGSPLPSDATCASEVRRAAETKSGNATYNSTRGVQKNLTGPYPTFARVDGNYTGTTDEILQWVACKWGIDEDVVRAQAAVESWWNQTSLGDWSTDPSRCAPAYPIGIDAAAHPGQCPESVGILQVRYPYWSNGFPEAETSTAYNADYAYAEWRACFEGEQSWLNTVDRVGTYGPGDLWGCIGVWYSGRWYTTAATGYISAVQGDLAQKVWAQPSFAQ